ncbi:hypothetical protein Pmar_PMAR011488 [Perkinsus marinus ATCC 50983]|uniref:Uncharacterized protein n=1 Tax=Perkinsus marinus (strain ATCC 50983 / TXsc) TaxID=423536 RepID=C5LBY3_PERM5|nr:hypothetical protein Pmar_PMAR011488 [Perkinsus marinus ATCC 50983]EER05466.1 hypothetical protein Pmar_PMAR011488 [Perkinsus marinus ATCC 50983]|eukprot:XP_002773650.1 hypothetical protein Pmar_PMAR011488 [Perkinsus marinus ATCC 50983]
MRPAVSSKHRVMNSALYAVGYLVLVLAFAVRSLQLLYTIAALLSRFVADRPHEMVGVNPLMPGVADSWAVLDGAVTALLPLVLALSMWSMASSDGAVLLCMSTRVNRQPVTGLCADDGAVFF